MELREFDGLNGFDKSMTGRCSHCAGRFLKISMLYLISSLHFRIMIFCLRSLIVHLRLNRYPYFPGKCRIQNSFPSGPGVSPRDRKPIFSFLDSFESCEALEGVCETCVDVEGRLVDHFGVDRAEV